jgi:hypothetical protein
MLVGLTGTHCTGKTTLAKTVADEFGYGFIRTSISDVLKDRGIDPAESMTIRQRIDAQMAILDALDTQWARAGSNPDMIWITDRTPVDLMAYAFGDVNPYTRMSDAETRDFDLCQRAVESTCKKFDLVIQVQMGIPVVEDESGKLRASRCPMYRKKLEVLIRGFGDAHLNSFFLLDRDCVDLYERAKTVGSLISTVSKTSRR